MNRKNITQILLIALLMSLLFLLFDTTNKLNTLDSQTSENTVTTKDSDYSQQTRVAQVTAGIQLPDLSKSDTFYTIDLNWPVLLVVFIISIGVTLVTQKYTNRMHVLRYLNIQLQHANFNCINDLNDKCEIAPQVTMEVNGDRVIFTVPNLGNYEQFGFQINGDHLQTTTHIERAGIKLQVLRLYLQTQRE